MINEENRNKIYIKPFIESLKKYLLIIILITGIISGSVFVLTKKLVEPKFESVGGMMVEVKIDNPEFTFQDMISYKNYLSNLIVETIKSDDILEVASRNLDKEFEVDQIRRNITVSLDANTQFIEIKVQANSSDKSSKLVAAVLEASSDKIPSLFDDASLKIVNVPTKGKKVSPNLRNSTILAGMFTFVVSLGILFLKFIFDTRIFDANQLEDQLNLPMIGTMNDNKNSDFSYMNINLIHLMKKKEAKTLLITSPLPRDGKSYISNGIVKELGKFNQKTLLIRFNIKGDGNIETGEDYDILHLKNIYEEESKIDVNDIADNIDSHLSNYDLVLIDSDSLTTSPEAQLLTQLCDQVLLVIRKNTHWNDIENSLNQLEILDSNVIGVVWNDYNEIK